MNVTLTLNRGDDFHISIISRNDIKETKALLSSVYTCNPDYRVQINDRRPPAWTLGKVTISSQQTIVLKERRN